MSVLVWRHGTTQAAAIEAIQAALESSGHANRVTWKGNRAEARYGPFASVSHVVGQVNDEAVVLERCGGIASGTVLGRCRVMLEQLFPGGEQK